MNLGIATIYKCYNFGSFYQAFALQEALKKLGYTPSFLDTDCTYNKQRRRQRLFSREYSVRKNLFSLRSMMAYRRDWRKLVVAKPDEKMDCVIAGSDEIWNIRNASFVEDGRYYGQTTPIPCIAYAPSIGGASFLDFQDRRELLDGIRTMTCWSARDQATEEFLKQVDSTREITRVLDPSFLIDWSAYEQPAPQMGKFILVYTYDGDWGFSPEAIRLASDFASKQGLPLYSFGFRNKWCDNSFACSPLEFLGYLRQAEYVLTDTFHGTVMSLQYHKKLACLAPDKQKIASMASWLGLDMKQWSIEELMQDKPYSKLDETVADMRRQSLDYLTKSLADVVGKQ